MRERKYRAWDGEKIVYHVYPNDYNEVVFFYGDPDKDKYQFEILKDIKGNPVSVKNLMDFTGLYDKNKVEIYEGDIVERNNKLLEIMFDSVRQFSGWVINKRGVYLEYDSLYNCKVIGNIYENPELLGEVKK